VNPVPAREVEAHLQAFQELCREKGFALTHQRQVIYREMLRMGGHPSPEAVYERVRRAIPSISLGTVYKNIKTFVDTGLLREVSLHHGSLRLEANFEPHHHLVCTRCRQIFDVPEKDLAPVKFRGVAPKGFRIQRISVELHGVCARCSTPASPVRNH
jgi:Fur family transcriptional regulator, peroxide stress response regulator